MNPFNTSAYQPRKKGKLNGHKSPGRRCDVWGIRISFGLAQNERERALSHLTSDSKLRACDMTKLRS